MNDTHSCNGIFSEDLARPKMSDLLHLVLILLVQPYQLIHPSMHTSVHLPLHLQVNKQIPFTYLPKHVYTNHINQTTCKSTHLPPCQRTYLPFNLPSTFLYYLPTNYFIRLFDKLAVVQALRHPGNIPQICNISKSSSYLIHVFYCRSAAAFTCCEVQQLQLFPKLENIMQIKQGRKENVAK